MKEQLHLSQIWHYPVKSLKGRSLQTSEVGVTGIQHDRQWMLVDDKGDFITQRQEPRMVLVKTDMHHGHLLLSAPGMCDLLVSHGAAGMIPTRAQVWGDETRALPVDAHADRWLSEFLQRDCKLVRLPAESPRQVDQTYAQPADRVGFADGFPFLLISQASLDDLNQRLTTSLPMECFRPNLVVSGCEAYAEDNWRRIRIGEITFRLVKPCSRCVIPGIDLETGQSQGKEPLRTLAQYRRQGHKVMFGQNLLHDWVGSLQLGMHVDVLE